MALVAQSRHAKQVTAQIEITWRVWLCRKYKRPQRQKLLYYAFHFHTLFSTFVIDFIANEFCLESFKCEQTSAFINSWTGLMNESTNSWGFHTYSYSYGLLLWAASNTNTKVLEIQTINSVRSTVNGQQTNRNKYCSKNCKWPGLQRKPGRTTLQNDPYYQNNTSKLFPVWSKKP